MELFEYIKSQLPQTPNTVIMKQLGASDELIDYVKETPENTNFTIAEVVGGSGGGDIGEVWLVGDTGVEQGEMMIFELSNVDATDHFTELATNGANYKVFLNGTELPYFVSEEGGSIWMNSDDVSTMTMGVQVYAINGTSSGAAVHKPASTAPTSVEVSVKHK